MTPTLTALLNRRATLSPDSPAYQSLDADLVLRRTLRYGDLLARARHIASALMANYARGAHIAVALEDGIDFLPCYFGCLLAGIACIPLDPHPSRALALLDKLANQGQIQALIAWPRLQSLLRSVSVPMMTPDMLEHSGARLPQVLPEPAPPDIAHLQLSSGSTRSPTIIAVSHANLMDNLHQIKRAFGLTAEDKGLVWLPHWHDMGLVGGLLAPLLCGFPVTLMRSSHFATEPLDWLRAISTLGITVSGGPPSAYQACARDCVTERLELGHWRIAFVGAEVIHARILDAFLARWRDSGMRDSALTCCYGLAEATLMVSSGSAPRPPVRTWVAQAELASGKLAYVAPGALQAIELVSSGQAVHACSLHVFAPHTGEIGEIGVSGDSIAVALGDHERRWHQASHEGKTYYLTGDLGFVDGNGELFVLGRQDEKIKINGRMMFLPDLEHFIASELAPSIAVDALVCRFDEYSNSAIVHIEMSASALRAPGLADSVRALRQKFNPRCLALFGVALGDIHLHRRGSIPRTGSGKIQRHRVAATTARELVSALRRPATDKLFLEEEIVIATALREVIGITGTISFEDSIYALGCTSLHAPALLAKLNRHFGIDLSLSQFMQAASIRHLALAYLQTRKFS